MKYRITFKIQDTKYRIKDKIQWLLMAGGQVAGFLKWRPQTAPGVGEKHTAKCTIFTAQNTGNRAKYLGGKYPETLEKKLWTKYMIVADTAHKLSGKLQDKIWGGQNTQDRTGVYGRDSRSQCGTLVTSRVRCRPRATSFSHAAAALVTRTTLVGWRCLFKLLQGSCSVLQFDDLRVEYTNWRWSWGVKTRIDYRVYTGFTSWDGIGYRVLVVITSWGPESESSMEASDSTPQCLERTGKAKTLPPGCKRGCYNPSLACVRSFGKVPEAQSWTLWCNSCGWRLWGNSGLWMLRSLLIDSKFSFLKKATFQVEKGDTILDVKKKISELLEVFFLSCHKGT